MRHRIWHERALELAETGMSWRKVAKEIDVSRSTVSDFLRWHQMQPENIPEKPASRQAAIRTDNDSTVTMGAWIQQQVQQTQVNKLTARKHKPTILVVADTQCKPTESLDYMDWIGKYIADKQPDIIVNIGDSWDIPSLSSYDKGKRSAEGRRLSDDIEAGSDGLRRLTKHFKEGYNPRLVFCLGNHEHRIDRYVEDNPELSGTLGTDKLPIQELGWELHPFLKPVEIEGIFFVHFLANPMNGKPYGGNALNILKTVGRSFVVGHKQVLDIAIRPTIDGKQQIGIVNGAAYPFFEAYKSFSGNNHFRGITVLHEVHDGFATPMFVSLDYLKEKYER